MTVPFRPQVYYWRELTTCPRVLTNGSAVAFRCEYVPTVQDMTTALLTEGDLDRGHKPDLTSPRGRVGGRRPKMIPGKLATAQALYVRLMSG